MSHATNGISISPRSANRCPSAPQRPDRMCGVRAETERPYGQPRRERSRPLSINDAPDTNRKLTAIELISALIYTDRDGDSDSLAPEGGDPMLRKVLHLAYHFVTVADEVPRHIAHTN